MEFSHCLTFIKIELHKEQPLLELRAFRSGYFMRGSILAWINQMAMFGSLLLITLFLQQVKGLFVIPQAVLSSIGLNIGGRLFEKHGARLVVIVGISHRDLMLFWFRTRLKHDADQYVRTEGCSETIR
ncbi:hypothetical protein [Brevibacillus reuszeri]|uniref:hypothetical protein n=1 Tax=Brevibacillus reuszeri TaxID=54915 RepID=UPI003D198D20